MHAGDRRGAFLRDNAGLAVRLHYRNIMQKTVTLFFVLVHSATAAGAEATRCGTDAFGNAVCLDRDGVVIAAPASADGARDAASGRAEESASRAGDREQRPRCGVDPFGNRVCR
jgi:hypothetical protein